MKGFVEMKCTNLGIETTCRLEGVSIEDKAYLFHCLKKALEVDALEWNLISGFMEFLEQYNDEKEKEAENIIDRIAQEVLKELLEGTL